MTTPQYVTPPTQDSGPPQWSEQDLILARMQGRNEDITRAHAAGQLANLVVGGPAVAHDAVAPRGRAIDVKDAAEVIRRYEAAAASTSGAFTKEI